MNRAVHPLFITGFKVVRSTGYQGAPQPESCCTFDLWEKECLVGHCLADVVLSTPKGVRAPKRCRTFREVCLRLLCEPGSCYRWSDPSHIVAVRTVS